MFTCEVPGCCRFASDLEYWTFWGLPNAMAEAIVYLSEDAVSGVKLPIKGIEQDGVNVLK